MSRISGRSVSACGANSDKKGNRSRVMLCMLYMSASACYCELQLSNTRACHLNQAANFEKRPEFTPETKNRRNAGAMKKLKTNCTQVQSFSSIAACGQNGRTHSHVNASVSILGLDKRCRYIEGIFYPVSKWEQYSRN